MALNIGAIQQASQLSNSMMLQAQQQQQLTQNSRPPAAGTLIVHDLFEQNQFSNGHSGGLIPSPYQNQVNRNSQHGEIVRHAVEQDGFHGAVVERQLGYNHDYQVSENAETALIHKDMTQQEARGTLDTFMIGQVKGMYDQQANMLNENTAGGARNSAANLSLGISQASITEDLYAKPFSAIQSDDPQVRMKGETMIRNQARAFELDPDKLLSEDPSVHGPERRRLQQGLADRARFIIDEHPVVQGARRRYDQAVSDFEANNNSVVISAGNDGEIKQRLEDMNHGRSIRTGPNFGQNILENDEVTSVGATRWYRNNGELSEQVAGYSSESTGVDIYASGSVGFGNTRENAESWGTSFAAPRVAGTMAELHRKHPEMTSSQIENLMKQQLTHGLNTSGGEVQVLDYNRSFEFLRNGTY